MKSSGCRSGAGARTAAAEAVASERLVWACSDICRLREWAKLTNNSGCLQHLRQVEVCTLQVTIAIRQPVSEILNLARHHHAAGLLGLLMDRRLQLAGVKMAA